MASWKSLIKLQQVRKLAVKLCAFGLPLNEDSIVLRKPLNLHKKSQWKCQFISFLMKFSKNLSFSRAGPENFRKVSKCFIRILRKMHYFWRIFKRFNKPCVRFSSVWTENTTYWEVLRKFWNFWKVFYKVFEHLWRPPLRGDPLTSSPLVSLTSLTKYSCGR